jgi:hypothetical protein
MAEARLQAVPVDSLDRVFPDRPPQRTAQQEPLSVPRGGSCSFQFAVTSPPGLVQLDAQLPADESGRPLDAELKLYHALPVHVEANNQGCSRTSAHGTPPAEWLPAFVRQAPFDVAEVLVPADHLEATANVTSAVLVDLRVSPNATPGQYGGLLRLRLGAQSAEAPFAVRVHPTVVPTDPVLHVTHWFWHEPRNLTNGEPPEWWSERHWQLLENSGRELRAFGQDSLFTPLIDYREPLIQAIRHADGGYSFDFSRFDRWMELFSGLGFRYFDGHHIATLPEKWAYEGVFVRDEATGKKEPLVPGGRGNEAWLAFIPVFYQALYAHLEAKGWTERYIQHQLDEPKDAELYRKLAALAREYMPKVRTVDAINSNPGAYSPLVGIQVLALTILAKEQALAAERRARGQEVWLYHCCSPPPPYPNRHLDDPLSSSRLYPWLAFWLQADGYLNWGANIYRGADPYRTSIGPVPSGSQDPGHPPGDNWFFYPGPNGLRGSMRMVAFRDGLCDHALLTLLARRDSDRAAAIVRQIVRSLRDYERDPTPYHRARTELLLALE